MKSSILKGLGVAMVTPFTSQGKIDYPALQRLIEYLGENGTDFLVAMGTTAETATLSDTEKAELLRFIVSHNTRKLPLVVGIGGNNTGKVVETLKQIDLTGVDAILSVTPYYNKPTAKGLELHFSAIADNSPVPIVLYNVPGRTGINMDTETTLKLARKFNNIIAVKEASGNLHQMACLLRDRPEGFGILSGDDGLTLPQLAIGADGVISVLGNALPALFSRMIKLAKSDRMGEAATIHLKLIELIDKLFVEGNPAGVKAALHALGIIENHLRLPLVPVSKATFQQIEALVQTLK